MKDDDLTPAERMGIKYTDVPEDDPSPWRNFRLYIGIIVFFPVLRVIGAGIMAVTLNEMIALLLLGFAIAVFAYLVSE
jgi:hypothetical protein